MIDMTKIVRPTAAVRRLMAAHGAASWLIFTNTYKTCRTVKCYTHHLKTVKQFKQELLDMFETLGYGCPQMYQSNEGGLIVRIPHSLQSK